MKIHDYNKDEYEDEDAKQQQEKYKYRKNSTLYFKSKFNAPPPGLFDQITPSFGLGVGVYFDLIQQFFAIFLIMFIVSIGCLYLNINGHGIYGEFKLELDVLTLANQPIFQSAESIKESEKSDYELRMNIYYICDCIYSIIFFCYLMYARKSTYKKLAKLKDQSDSIKYFTVQVTGFPENTINAYDIKNHFENLEEYEFNVAECILQRNYQDTLRFQHEKLKLQQKLEIELNRSDLLQEKTEEETQIRDEKLKHLREQILLIDQKIKNQISSNLVSEELSSVKAFVTFANRIQRKNALNLYKSCGGVQAPELKYNEQQTLVVSKADDPSCILWENQDATLPDVYALKSLTIIVGTIITILVLITFLIFSKNYTDTWRIDEVTCLSNLDMNKTDPRYEQCICMPGSKLKADTTVNCESYSVSVPNTIFGFVMSVFLFLIRIFMDLLNQKERHQTRVKQIKGTFFSILFWMSLCSIVFMFFFHFTFDNRNVNLQEFFAHLIPPFKDSQSIMTVLFPSDIDRNWIINVGYKITLICLFNSLFPQILVLTSFLVFEWFNEQKQEKKRIDFVIDRNPNLNIRKDHPEINKNNLFTLPDKYAQLAFTCFLGFIFSGPIPILLLITAISLCFQILFDRYMLMRYNSFDIIEHQRLETDYVKFAIYFLKWMPWCVILHLLFSIYNFSQPQIFPDIQALNFILTDNDVPNKFAQRLAKSIILSGLLGFFLLILLFTDILKLNGCLKKKKKVNLTVLDEEKAAQEDAYIKCLNKIQQQGKLITYDISENEDYLEIIDQIFQESEKNGIKNKEMELSKMEAENYNQQQSSRKQNKVVSNQNLNHNQSLNESHIKIDAYGLDNSLVNPNNMSQMQNNEEEHIIRKKLTERGSKQQIGSSKISQRDLDKEINLQNQINEEEEREEGQNNQSNSKASPKKQKAQLKVSIQQQSNEKKKKKKIRDINDSEIQNIIKDYQ